MSQATDGMVVLDAINARMDRERKQTRRVWEMEHHHLIVAGKNNYACGYLRILGAGTYNKGSVTCRECQESKGYSEA